jgi:hypothetical protein
MDDEFGVGIVLAHTHINLAGVALHTTAHADFGEKTACGIVIPPSPYFERLDADQECVVDCGLCLRVLDSGRRTAKG